MRGECRTVMTSPVWAPHVSFTTVEEVWGCALDVPTSNVTMASPFLPKVLICQKPFGCFFHQGAKRFSSRRWILWRPPRPDCEERCLSTRGSGCNTSGGKTDRDHGGRSGTAQNTKGEGLWGDRMGGGLSPTSVFAAGTTRRTAEMLRRKSPQDQDQPAGASRKTGDLLLPRVTLTEHLLKPWRGSPWLNI